MKAAAAAAETQTKTKKLQSIEIEWQHLNEEPNDDNKHNKRGDIAT